MLSWKLDGEEGLRDELKREVEGGTSRVFFCRWGGGLASAHSLTWQFVERLGKKDGETS